MRTRVLTHTHTHGGHYLLLLSCVQERMAVKDYNFRQLDNLLLPPYSRFLLWLSVQDETFFDEASGLAAKANGENPDKKKPPTVVKKDTLWSTLIGDLALTYEQDEKLKSLYKCVLRGSHALVCGVLSASHSHSPTHSLHTMTVTLEQVGRLQVEQV